MLTKYNFELELEELAEEFYFNPGQAVSQVRGGNSTGNEVYFGGLTKDLLKRLGCQLLELKKGQCPDSGVFGDFRYQKKSQINWQLIRNKSHCAIAVKAAQGQERYILFPSEKLSVTGEITRETKIILSLSDLDEYGEFFGIEYKATNNDNANSISVASFNSTCPCETKTVQISRVKLIHNLPTTLRKNFDGDNKLKVVDVKLNVSFTMYYFIVNDTVVDRRNEIKKIFLCSGGYFAPGVSEEKAEDLSKQKMPSDFGLKNTLYKVGLRYRPFLEARRILCNGYGLYTSWEPKIPKKVKEEQQIQDLLDEVMKIGQEDFNEQSGEYVPVTDTDKSDNVIYLCLSANRIKDRAA